MRTERGFTLLEVLVAMTFLAIMLGTLFESMGQYARNGALLKEKTLAGWVARNQIVEWQLKKPWPSPQEKKGMESMAGHDWTWMLRISNTEDPEVRRIDVEVRKTADAKNPLIHYVGSIEKK
ncbi:MAG: type II secretion system minor pseudopilin GspI [Gammaproteobacteria bacterium]|nr:type II secretion system minor pseudopilin GspI [Gammaproteobacteria bacterium]